MTVFLKKSISEFKDYIWETQKGYLGVSDFSKLWFVGTLLK